MPRLLAILLCLSATVMLSSGESAAEARWRNQREQTRKERSEFSRLLAADRARRAQEAEKQLLALATKAGATPAAAQLADLQDLLRGIRHLDAERAAALESKLPSKTGPDLDAAALKTWAAAVRSARRIVIKPLENLFNQAVLGGQPSLAYTMARGVLAFDPDHEGLHRIMGETQVDGRWYGAREMEYVKAGLRWDHDLGWMLPKEKARYDKGEVLDLGTRTWAPLDALQAKHNVWTSPWEVKSDHLLVRGTADLKDLAQAAERLELFHEQVFAAFSGFFLDAKQRDPKLLFGTAKSAPLVVNIARDKDDYRNALPPGTDAGWSAGMFIPAVPASFFYAGQEQVLYHEFTHQVFHVFTGMDRAPVWAVEGIAVYCETPIFVDGALTLGELRENKKIVGHIFGLYASPSLTLDALLAITDGKTWSGATDPGPQYGAAGCFTTYCMESDDRAHREDYIDFLRDAYRGQLQGHAVWDYLGMDKAALTSGYEAWLEAQRKAIPKPTWHFTK